MAEIKIYLRDGCPYCHAAKDLLDDLGVDYEKVDVIDYPEERERVSRENGDYDTVPMIIINGKFIGGYSDLLSLQKSGELQKLISEN